MEEDHYNVGVPELREFMKDRSPESLERMNSLYNGVTGLANALKVDMHKGLKTSDREELDRRLAQYGANILPPNKAKTFLQLCWEACQDTTLIILICASIGSLALSLIPGLHGREGEVDDGQKKYEWIESVAIMMAVVIVILVTAGNDWHKEKKFKGLQDRIAQENFVAVLRDGSLNTLNVAELLVGDIVHIKYGDQVPADGLLLQSNDLKLDESPMTGESQLVKKSVDKCPWLLAGTYVMEGSGRMLTVGVGRNSQTGIIFTLLGATKEDLEEDGGAVDKNAKANGVPKVELVVPGSASENGLPARATETDVDADLDPDPPADKEGEDKKGSGGGGGGIVQDKSILQSKLTKLTILIGKIGTIAALMVIIVLFARYLIDELIEGNGPSLSWLSVFVGHIIIGVTVLVVAVPEGLPLAVTISLAYSVSKMLNDKNLVRHLDACETMGSATTICSDKTGTLTKNRMTVTQLYALTEHFKDVSAFQPSSELRDLLATAIAVNSGYTSQIMKESPQDPNPRHMGNKTECSLLGLLIKLGVPYQDIRDTNPEDSFLKVFTFNSARKSMSTVIRLPDGTKRLLTKGASETILKKCAFQLDASGQVVPMAKRDIDYILKSVVEPMAMDALRTICIAYRDFSADEEIDYEDEISLISNLVCIAITGIEDPVRDEVPEAIAKCQNAGITVRMVTGDNIMTARSIALKCGIIKPQDDFLVIDGKEFNKRIRNKEGLIEQRLLDKVWPQLRVLARSSPTDKHTLVKGIIDSQLPGAHEVVAVTGDGTNDGPALKKADVGFAMGIAGTGVAKEASDIILTDDNFSSIVSAVKWGRNVYDGIAKFLQFQLTVNFVAIVLAFSSACILQATPLKAIHLLWVNLIMDTMASLALATETPTDDLLERKPYGRTKPLISPIMARNILGHGLYQLLILYIILFAGPMIFTLESADWGDDRKAVEPSDHYTLIFNVFVLMQCFNEINARKIHGERNVFRGIFGNYLFIGIVVGTAIVQVLIVEFGGYVAFTTHLSIDLWLWSLAISISVLAWGQVLNCIPPEKLPKFLSWGEGEVDESDIAAVVKPPVASSVRAAADADGEAPAATTPTDNRSRVLWVRGVTRIQQQIRVVDAWKEINPGGGERRPSQYQVNHNVHDFMHTNTELFPDIDDEEV